MPQHPLHLPVLCHVSPHLVHKPQHGVFSAQIHGQGPVSMSHQARATPEVCLRADKGSTPPLQPEGCPPPYLTRALWSWQQGRPQEHTSLSEDMWSQQSASCPGPTPQLSSKGPWNDRTGGLGGGEHEDQIWEWRRDLALRR